MKNSIRANLGKQSRTVILATGISLVSLISLADYLTGYEISVSALYLAPISLAAWYGGQISGFAVSITSAASWLLTDLRLGHSFSHPALPLWNAAVLLISFFVVAAILARLRSSNERQVQLVGELREALDNVKVLKGMIPICAWCKKIRDDEGYWEEVEAYFAKNSEAIFTHGMCPVCRDKLEENLKSFHPVKSTSNKPQKDEMRADICMPGKKVFS